MASLREAAMMVSWASARDAQAATAKRGKPSEKGKAVCGEDANGHDTGLACPSVFPANARRIKPVPG